MFCYKCGHNITNESVKFCPKCGSQLNRSPKGGLPGANPNVFNNLVTIFRNIFLRFRIPIIALIVIIALVASISYAFRSTPESVAKEFLTDILVRKYDAADKFYRPQNEHMMKISSHLWEINSEIMSLAEVQSFTISSEEAGGNVTVVKAISDNRKLTYLLRIVKVNDTWKVVNVESQSTVDLQKKIDMSKTIKDLMMNLNR